MTIYHKHHIIPRHAGGTDDPSNIVLLTVEEHAEAHRLLYEEHGRWQDRVAWQALSGMIGKEEIIRQINSEAHKGKIPWNKGKTGIYSEESRKKMSETHTGKTLSEETKRKLSEAGKGKKLSEEIKRKISESKKGENNPFFGKTHSEEARRKISEAAKNPSEETRRKLSESKKGENNPNFGKKHSEEARRKMSEAAKGKVPWNKGKTGVYSEETKRKLSEAAKKHWAKKKSETE